MRLQKTLATLVVLAVAACDQDPVGLPTGDAPVAPPPVSYQDAVLDRQPSPQHVILTEDAPGPDLLAAIADAGGEVVFQHPIGFVFARGLDEDAAGALAGFESVTNVASDVWIARDEPALGEASGASAEIASPDDPASAFFFPRQWNMRAIQAEPAWDAGRTGSSDVTVAILDTGVDPVHWDLAGRVDASRSISFVEIDDLLASAFFPTREIWTDLHYHGTHVASTAVSNGLVAAGVTSMPTIMAVRVCTVTNFSCSFGAVVSGILHAVDNGADVANLSLGGGFPKSEFGEFVEFINELFNYARSNGTTMVVAAGNAAADLDRNGNTYATYCDSPGVICVSATGPTFAPTSSGPFENVDTPAPYTNFGRSAISVAAPGGNFAGGLPWGGVWAACSTTSLVVPVCQTNPTFIVSLTGTSMATPHVSGLAALVVEDVGNQPGRVKTRIQQGADDVGPRGTDEFSGKGRINVARTLGVN
ncbi:MAG TPA: S8 family serine peptidase [Longimicrobiales bacterium]|nr:S8 family serine peptidase [Longimicrobiales bacterium]